LEVDLRSKSQQKKTITA